LSARYLGSLLGLAVLLVCNAAHAQRVVVLEFHNDKSGKLRTQVERALRQSGSVEVESLRQYKAAAAKRKFKGARAMTPEAVAHTAKVLGLNGAVRGVGGKSLRIHIWDSSGAELSQIRFLLKHAALSERDARRLADAVALTLGGKKGERASGSAKVEAPTPIPERRQNSAPAPPSAKEADASSESGADREKRQREEMAEAHTVSPPDAHASSQSKDRSSSLIAVEKKGPRVGPKLISAQVTGTTTWRSYCSRPGFSSCAQYNALDPAQRPPGDTVDFRAEVPYMGFALAGEFFPFAESSSLVNGLGLLVGYERGFSLTNVVTSAGAPSRQVYATDQGISALATFRLFFTLGHREPLLGHGGIHLGFGTRRFDVEAPLPGSHRNYPVIGLDVSIPVWKFFRVEGSGNYFLSPKPSSSEITDHGSTVSARGWGADVGAAGDVWGPLGYLVRLRYSHYKDQFSGSGVNWQDGGAAEESYLGVYWGVSAHF
jgi:hypothetical protein